MHCLQKFLDQAKCYWFLQGSSSAEKAIFIQSVGQNWAMACVIVGRMKPDPAQFRKNKLCPARKDWRPSLVHPECHRWKQACADF